MNEFHFDGLRMDAVGNLIYWQGDASRGENLAALKFIRTMNQGLKEESLTASFCRGFHSISGCDKAGMGGRTWI